MGLKAFAPNRNKGGLPQAATRHRSLVGGPQQVEDRGGRGVKERSFLTDRSSSAWLAAMGRPRAFDEDEAVRAAVTLFGGRAYDGVSVDDLVSHLGVHRNSLYKTFGSKRGLYLTALRRHLADDVGPLLDALAGAPDAAAALRLVTSADLGLLLLAITERAPVDEEVAAEVNAALAAVDRAVADALGVSADLATAVTAAALGIVLRGNPDNAATALAQRLSPRT
ncbi:TetR family transcriptional regulator [Streptomyces anthocyanicus]|nr:TetR family transcriptional regulator [Streptomyces anthocyanicus]